MVRAFEQEARWIIEGGISTTYPTRLARAQMVIWLDLPVGQRLMRVLRRSWRYRGGGRADLPKGCVERFDRETFAFLKWIWEDREKGRERILKKLAEPPAHLKVRHLPSSAEVATFQHSFAQV